MRVLIINTSEQIGGAAIAANRLMEALKKSGVRAKMLVRDKQTDHLTVVRVKSNWRLPFAFLWERIVIFVSNLFSRKNLFQVDIANTGADVTELMDFKRADVIHLHWVNQGFLSLKSIEKIMQSGKKVVITMHDQWYFTGICHYSGECEKYKEMCCDCQLMRGKLLGDWAERVYMRKRDIYKGRNLTFVGCSRWIADLARESKLTEGQKVVNIPNAIDTSVFRPQYKTQARQLFSLPLDKKLLLFGSQRITDERKGFWLLVEALNLIKKEHPEIARDTEIVVVGGDSEKVKAALPFQVFTVSYVSDVAKMVSLYNAVDVYVTPSLQDNLPNTIVESMACGIPCVGFNVGGIPEMIDHKENGYVAKYKDAADLANGIMWTLTDNYAQLSRNARVKAVDTYGEEAVAKKYIEVYED